MKDNERLEIYERNQYKLIKALTAKIKENKELKNRNVYLSALCINYGTFLNSEQINAAHIMAEAMSKKVMTNDPA